MRSAVFGFIVVIVLFVVSAMSWNEAKLTRRVADAHQRLATLHYDANDDLDNASGILSRIALPIMSVGGDVRHHRATVSYWRGQYDALAEMGSSTGDNATSDPTLLLVAANSQFRTIDLDAPERKLVVERLDAVIQQYADILRKDPTLSDAAFNFEYVVKVRDLVAAKAAGGKNAPKEKKVVRRPDLVSVDLPTGTTVHGHPGGPPDGTDMSDFKTITPMRYDEREEEMQPGQGRAFKRKG